MDLKAPLLKYERTVNVKLDWENIKKSVKIIIESGLPYEFRTTVVPGLLEKDDFEEMGQMIKGAKKWYLQIFKSDTDLVNQDYYQKKAYTRKEMAEFVVIGRKYVELCELRG